MNIICPHCNFSKTVDPDKLPDRPVKVNCPKCSKGFTFDKSRRPVFTTNAGQAAGPPEQISCPACGLVQDQRDQCKGCGVVYAKLQAQRQANGQSKQSNDMLHSNLAELRRKAENQAPQHQAKAGFWIRAIAYILDFLLLGFVQLVLSLLIDQVIGLLGIASEGDPAVNMVIWLFGASLSIGYAVFFTGYCGQTPGKMALRIKVIRTDGRPVGYGRAVLREVPGKFISSVLLGIGYLMVAFDSQKQGLHDKIADTYVIKL
ncbi:MAG: zinc-ribbon domain-containing protein [Desulfuromonadales bacterium]|nr:zinc-ribbon domain-containing protein [Desulfuromonadales bacterium]